MSNLKLNNWDEVKIARKAIEERSPKLSEAMENVWPLIVESHKKINESENFQFHADVYKRDNLGSSDVTPLDTFLMMTRWGLYPPPEIMLWIVNCFDTYLQRNGEVSLEEVFFGRGNFALRKRKESKYELFDLFVEAKEDISIDGKTVSSNTQLVEAYYKWLNENLETVDKPDDIESFLRGYRRWKNKTDK